ncbi:MAG: hypothetical protein JJE17_00085 [Peptostreptococcaceae bacterium]|nr:hypothetical protein [Peptostreptococcaceae bacterium]
MNRLKKFFLNPWTIGIGTSLIVTVITAWSKNINVLQAIKWLLSNIFAFVVFLFTFKIPVYVILLSIFALVLILHFIRDKNPKIEWLTYKQTNYKKWFFIWDYILDYNKKYSINNLRPICSCGCSLVKKTDLNGMRCFDGILYCPICKNTYPVLDQEVLDEVKCKIEHNITHNLFPKDNNND